MLIVVAAAARSLSLTFLHPLNWDEIEFFRATDWVRQGLVPYRDFFEHHTPLQWFLFAPIVSFVRSPGAAAVITMRWAGSSGRNPKIIAMRCRNNPFGPSERRSPM